jgi:hypothetical protein
MLISTQVPLVLVIALTFLGILQFQLRFAKKAMTSLDERPGMVLLYLWLVGSLIGILLGGDWWPHYLIQGIAPLAVWLAVTLSRSAQAFPRYLSRLPSLLTLLLLLLPYQVVVSNRADAEQISNDLYSTRYTVSEAVAEYVQTQTAPGTPIYAAFSEPEVYVQANRPSAFRHLYGNEISVYPAAQIALVSLIASPERPGMILDFDLDCRCQFPELSRSFWAVVPQYYHLETTIGGVDVYRRN